MGKPKQEKKEKRKKMSTLTSEEMTTVIDFLREFEDAVVEEDYVSDEEKEHKIKQLYEHRWNALTAEYFKNESWPTVEKIEEEGLDLSPEFKILYKELYYKHIYDKVGNSKKDKESDFG